MSKSPYRKGIQITVSNAAVQAAATIVGAGYRGIDGNTPGRIMNLAAALVDEIEMRAADTGTPDAVIKQWADEAAAA